MLAPWIALGATGPGAMQQKAKFFGWRVVAGAFVLAIFGWGVGFYGPPVFLHVVVARTGWSVAVVSSAVTFHFLAGAVLVANLPRLYGRLGLLRSSAPSAPWRRCSGRGLQRPSSWSLP